MTSSSTTTLKSTLSWYTMTSPEQLFRGRQKKIGETSVIQLLPPQASYGTVLRCTVVLTPHRRVEARQSNPCLSKKRVFSSSSYTKEDFLVLRTDTRKAKGSPRPLLFLGAAGTPTTTNERNKVEHKQADDDEHDAVVVDVVPATTCADVGSAVVPSGGVRRRRRYGAAGRTRTASGTSRVRRGTQGCRIVSVVRYVVTVYIQYT